MSGKLLLVQSLSLLRVVLAPVFVWCVWRVPPMWAGALSIIAVAAASDFFDGLLARLWRVQTALGAALDPLGDKVFCLTVLAALTYAGHWPRGLWWAMVARDAVLVVGFGWLRARGALGAAQPLLSGKIYTALVLFVIFMRVAALFLQNTKVSALQHLVCSASGVWTVLWAAVWLSLVVSAAHYAVMGAKLWKVSLKTG
jgi:phosphatidylglycerophosphate synthase